VSLAFRRGTHDPDLTSSKQFSRLCDVLSSVSESRYSWRGPAYIYGDLKLNVLKYQIRNHVSEYVHLLSSHGMLQNITKLTRGTLTSAQVVDPLQILTSKISDHFPIIHLLSVAEREGLRPVVEY
jgi:hypothetical protein